MVYYINSTNDGLMSFDRQITHANFKLTLTPVQNLHQEPSSRVRSGQLQGVQVHSPITKKDLLLSAFIKHRQRALHIVFIECSFSLWPGI